MRQIIENKLLPKVQKPARYLGTEWNTVHKDWERTLLKMAFAFPDVYEIAMSHLGLQIIYGLVNSREDALLERVFAPGIDLEALLREYELPLFSLESCRSMRDFDLVGFTLQYEMSYTNILNMLALANIPVEAVDRGHQDPLIMGGGPCAANPEPLASFFDLFLLGDAEEALGELLDLAAAWKKKQGALDREDFLLAAAQINGIYVPQFYDVEYTAAGEIAAVNPNRPGIPARVKRRVVADLDSAYFPTAPLVPFIDVVHDRAMVEVLRGCTRGCRFCQAGIIYRPVRERSPQILAEQARAILEGTGHDELSLTSLSTADYTCLEPLLKELTTVGESGGVSISLPSLRVDAFSVGIAEKLQKGRKTGLTFAPEAGTQRLRDVINKGVTEQDLLEAATAAFEAGWTGIKLYFMLGLPTETDEDLAGIAQMAHRVLTAGRAVSARQQRKKGVRVTVSVSTYVPKAHTPFQWEPQDALPVIKRKQQYLKKLFKRGITFNYHDAELSFLEAVFAKGDRRLGVVLKRAWQKGCKFDSWREHFSFAAWSEAFQETGVEPEFYANRSWDMEDMLPWEHLDMGVNKSFLQEEREKALQAQLTPDCRTGLCGGCDVCTNFGVDLDLRGEQFDVGTTGI